MPSTAIQPSRVAFDLTAELAKKLVAVLDAKPAQKRLPAGDMDLVQLSMEDVQAVIHDDIMPRTFVESGVLLIACDKGTGEVQYKTFPKETVDNFSTDVKGGFMYVNMTKLRAMARTPLAEGFELGMP